MNGPRLASLLADQDEEFDILGMPRKKRRGFGYIGESPQYNSLEAYYRSKTPQEIFSQYTPSAPPPLNLQTPEPKPLDEFASVESEYTPYRPDKPVGPPTGAPTAPPLDPRDYRQAILKDEPARPLFSGMLPSQFPEAYQIGYTPQNTSAMQSAPPPLMPQTPPPIVIEERPLPPSMLQTDVVELPNGAVEEPARSVTPVQQNLSEQPLFGGMLPSQFQEAYQIGYTPSTATPTPTPTPPAAIAPAAPEAPIAVNPDAERLAAALQAQQQQQEAFMAMQAQAEREAEMRRQAEIQRQAEMARQAELARIEEERRRAAAEAAGVDDGSGR